MIIILFVGFGLLLLAVALRPADPSMQRYFALSGGFLLLDALALWLIGRRRGGSKRGDGGG